MKGSGSLEKEMANKVHGGEKDGSQDGGGQQIGTQAMRTEVGMGDLKEGFSKEESSLSLDRSAEVGRPPLRRGTPNSAFLRPDAVLEDRALQSVHLLQIPAPPSLTAGK